MTHSREGGWFERRLAACPPAVSGSTTATSGGTRGRSRRAQSWWSRWAVPWRPHRGRVAARGRRADSRRAAGRSRSSGRRGPAWVASRTTRAPAGNPSRRKSTKIGHRAMWPMITSNAVGVYSDDGKHTAPPGHDNNNACRPVSRHNRLIASRAASVTIRRPPRISTRSEEPRQRCTVIACQHLRYCHHNPARENPSRPKTAATDDGACRTAPPYSGPWQRRASCATSRARRAGNRSSSSRYTAMLWVHARTSALRAWPSSTRISEAASATTTPLTRSARAERTRPSRRGTSPDVRPNEQRVKIPPILRVDFSLESGRVVKGILGARTPPSTTRFPAWLRSFAPQRDEKSAQNRQNLDRVQAGFRRTRPHDHV